MYRIDGTRATAQYEIHDTYITSYEYTKYLSNMTKSNIYFVRGSRCMSLMHVNKTGLPYKIYHTLITYHTLTKINEIS